MHIKADLYLMKLYIHTHDPFSHIRKMMSVYQHKQVLQLGLCEWLERLQTAIQTSQKDQWKCYSDQFPLPLHPEVLVTHKSWLETSIFYILTLWITNMLQLAGTQGLINFNTLTLYMYKYQL